jgi:hypothetical protein
MGLTVRVPSNPLPGTQNLLHEFHEVAIARLYAVSCADHGLLPHAFWLADDYLRAMAPTRLLRRKRGPAGRSGAGAVRALTPRSTTSTGSPPTAPASGAQVPSTGGCPMELLDPAPVSRPPHARRRDVASTRPRPEGERDLVSRVVDSLMSSDGSWSPDQDVHRHEYEVNQ